MTADAQRARPLIGTRYLSPAAAAWLALAALGLASGLFIYHQTRGTTLWFDDWSWVLHRRGGSLSTWLDSYNDHLSLVPIAIYKLLFATAGLHDYAPYRVLVTVAQLGCVALVFGYAYSRVGAVLALTAAAVVALFGPGWQNFLWPFQLAWLISIAAGIGALLLLDRGGRRAAVGASVLLGISLASSGLGVAFALGVIVEVAASRRWRELWWVPAAPVALYGLWWIGYQTSTVTGRNIQLAPGFTAHMASESVAALVGLAGSIVPSSAGTLDSWGPPLLVLALAGAGWRLLRLGHAPPRVLALATTAIAFWVLTAVTRATFGAPYSSRYLYVGAVLILLIGVELARGARLSWGVRAAVVVLAAAAIVSNAGLIRDGGAFLRGEADVTRADLSALRIGSPVVGPGYVAQHLPGYPFEVLTEGDYLAASRALGLPTANDSQLGQLSEAARAQADLELISMHGAAIQPATLARPLTGCSSLAPPAVVANGASATGALTGLLHTNGVLIRGPAQVAIRRFGSTFEPLGSIAAGAAATLRMRPDLSSRPWQLQITTTDRASVCPL